MSSPSRVYLDSVSLRVPPGQVVVLMGCRRAGRGDTAGTTRFLSAASFRNAQQSIVALDIIAPMDALAIEKAILAGHDRGADGQEAPRATTQAVIDVDDY